MKNLVFKLGDAVGNSLPATLGGKGFQLAELAALRYTVPRGFVISTEATRQFWQSIPHLTSQCVDFLHNSSRFEVGLLNNQSERIRTLVESATIPERISRELMVAFDRLGTKRVAVRSSATEEDGRIRSFAGQFDTSLFVARSSFLHAVKRCWSSIISARSLAYTNDRNRDWHDGLPKFAVVVQEMIDADTSGVCFTRHPQTQSHEHLLVEAVWGVGESLVNGEVTPDEYTVAKSSLGIIEKQVREQQTMRVAAPNGAGTRRVDVPDHLKREEKVSAAACNEICRIAVDLERVYQCSCDVEWAVANNQIHLLQCRPLTA